MSSAACPRPDKTAYATENAARGYHADDLARMPGQFNVYLCRCGSWHGGRLAADRTVHTPPDMVRSFGPVFDTTVAAVARILEP